ncbi:hypothetical protein BH10BAC3_BH10BAC3_12030 [soil metagenome]
MPMQGSCLATIWKMEKSRAFLVWQSMQDISCYSDREASLKFTNKETPIPELEAKFNSFNYNTPGIRYLAIYVTPFTKEQSAQQEVRVFARVREFLLNRNVVNQTVEPVNIYRDDFQCCLTTMSVAIVAKLGGKPWRLHESIETELIVGVGAFLNPKTNVKYLGASVCFNNSGRFNDMRWFEQNELNDLAGALAAKVREYAQANGQAKRLIIHLYKSLKDEEIAPIEKALEELELPNPIPIYIVTINKTESTDFIAFDYDKPNLLMPETGTYIYLGHKKYLLFNNARVGNYHRASDGYHFPVKLSINANKPEYLTEKAIADLIDQVYYFSKLYYKSLSQQNLPVTLAYLDMIAEMVPYFEHPTIPDLVRDRPWFL